MPYTMAQRFIQIIAQRFKKADNLWPQTRPYILYETCLRAAVSESRAGSRGLATGMLMRLTAYSGRYAASRLRSELAGFQATNEEASCSCQHCQGEYYSEASHTHTQPHTHTGTHARTSVCVCVCMPVHTNQTISDAEAVCALWKLCVCCMHTHSFRHRSRTFAKIRT
jgi:hypothetical protein